MRTDVRSPAHEKFAGDLQEEYTGALKTTVKEPSMSSDNSLDRRDFLRKASAVSVALGTAGAALGKGTKSSSARSSGRVLGANDRITVGVIGVGGRGTYVGNTFAALGEKDNSCQIVAVADTYQKR